MKKKELNSRIQEAFDGLLASVPKAKRKLAEVVLRPTRKQIDDIVINRLDGEDLSLDNIGDLCSDLGQAHLVHTKSVLENVGIPHLEEEILDHRMMIKWEFLLADLPDLIESEQPFSPDDIRRADPALYKALRLAIVQDTKDGEAWSWESLRVHLPSEYQSWFEVVKTSEKSKRERIENEVKDDIQKFDLTEALPVLGDDPKKMQAYLELMGIDTNSKKGRRIVQVSFSGVNNEEMRRIDKVFELCDPVLDDIRIDNELPEETDRKMVTIEITAPVGAAELMISAPGWSRRKTVNGERSFTLDVPLHNLGKDNEINIIAHNYDFETDNKNKRGQRTRVESINILQTSEDDTDALVEILEMVGQEKLEEMKKDKARKAYFIKFLEEMTIKRFAGNFEDGVRYMEELKEVQAEKKAKFVVSCINAVLRKFKKVQRKKYPFLRKVDEQGRPIDLAFFQKYCVYRAEEILAEGKPVVIANEPGLGKTITALAVAQGMEAIVICPNQAASTWIEEETKFCRKPFLQNVAGLGTTRGVRAIEGRKVPGVVANVEFTRYKGDAPSKKRISALNRQYDEEMPRIIVIDEAHYLRNDSDQSTGYTMLEAEHNLLLSASPWRNASAVRGVMSKVLPDDIRFKSSKAFKKAFPDNDPQKLQALFLMMQEYVVRFLKSEVMPTYDPSLPLEDQRGLPAKEHINPELGGFGSYTLTPAQEESILKFFEDWEEWNEIYEDYLPRDSRAVKDGVRKSQSDDSLSKMHSLRYIMNHPKYVGSDETSPKMQEAMRILDHELEQDHKVLVFCRYQAQVREYMDMLSEKGIGFSTYYGEVRKGDYVDSKGYKLGKGKKILKYKVDEYGGYVLENGRPVLAEKGDDWAPILALDYERLIFQNDPNVKVCIGTYSAGSQSVTFTAADAIIKDGLADGVIEEYQADDRIHRMDQNNKKYSVRYYSLSAKYSDEFLEEMKGRETNDQYGERHEDDAYTRWFEQGTYHQVQLERLAIQRIGFEILNNGIVTDPDLSDEGPDFNFS